MTKRPSPFEPNICRQSKIHLNNYENDVIALRNVEERTLKKLLEGAKKLGALSSNGHHVESDNEFHHKTAKWMQTCVTNYFTVNGKKVNENGTIVINSLDPPGKCSFCDTTTSSVYQCVQCSEYYCSTCSFVSYESFEDNRICLSCS